MSRPAIGTPDEIARWRNQWRILGEIREQELRATPTEAKLKATAKLFGTGALNRHPELYSSIPQWAVTWEKIRRMLSAA